MATYFLIEAIRMYLPAIKNMIAFFLFDQLLHIEVLAGIVIWWQQIHVLLDFLQSPVLLIYTTGIVFVTLPLSVIIRIMVSRWETAAGAGNDDTLQNAGSYIGMLERLCILLFAMIGRLSHAKINTHRHAEMLACCKSGMGRESTQVAGVSGAKGFKITGRGIVEVVEKPQTTRKTKRRTRLSFGCNDNEKYQKSHGKVSDKSEHKVFIDE
ncbi:MAG: DUF3307 domain-containing protein [Bacteroidetes bacterium]|nr:MAG: DUF3307 domain-containing protein [Bacteroidota bacterium]